MVMEQVKLMAIDVNELVLYVLIIAIATIGNVEWLKKLITTKNPKAWALIAMATLVINANMQMPYIAQWVTVLWNLIALGSSVMQFGKKALIDGIPNLINKAMGNAQTNKGEK
jgi:hypothetical protein